jgi:zinc protease
MFGFFLTDVARRGGHVMSLGDKRFGNSEVPCVAVRRFVPVFVLLWLLVTCALPLLCGRDCQAALSYTVETLGKDASGPLVPLTKVTYSNGLVALVKESHSSPIVTVDAWCHTGSAAEKEGIGGISHFFEHMFFKGTKKHPAGEMDKIIKGLGGVNNAGTSIEYTHYYVTVPSENYLVAVDVLSDALINSSFDSEELTREREVVEAEIRRKEDAPASFVFVVFQKQFGAGTPYEKPVLGTFATLDAIDRQTFLDYLAERYTAGNTVVVATGDVNTDEIAKAIAEYFAAMKPGKNPYPDFKVQELTSDRVGIERKDVKQGYMMLGFLTQALKNAGEYFPLEVAAAILGEGKSSRLYQSLVEKKRLATSISAWSWPLSNAGILGFTATFEPDKEDSLEAALLEELKALASTGPSPKEVEKAKALLKTSFAFSTETTEGRASLLGEGYTKGVLDDFLHYRERLDSVTPPDVQKIVGAYTSGKHYALAMILPGERPKKSEPPKE